MAEDRPTPRVILQRIRNRVIEDLETAASYDEQQRYQEAVPFVNVATEVVCIWADDHVSAGWRLWFLPPVFTPEEVEAVASFDQVLHAVADAFPRAMPQLAELIGSEPWERLRLAAAESSAIFSQRGRLSEETEDA